MDLWAFLNAYQHSLSAQGQMRFMIDSEENDADALTVGCIDLCDYDADARTAYVSIFIAMSMRRQGYARAALNALIPQARALGLRQLLAAVSPLNAASLSLFASADFFLIAPSLFSLSL